MKHSDILSKMTIEEKAALLSGSSEWTSREYRHLGIPALFLADGPHGIRKQEGAGDHLGLNESVPATCFPTAAAVANSWDEALGEEIGRALGEEACAQGVDVLLGPGLNIKRSPLCGRNFEYFSEDPYLSGKMAAAYVRGIQSEGVTACIKHFAVNSQELRRMAMNAVVDVRTLREIYLTGFEIAVKEGGAQAIMTSYNQINETYANENAYLLKDILRGEWKFDGLVVTDWGGSNDHVEGVKCRSALEMPTPGFDSAVQLLQAVADGRLTEAELDICVDDVVDAALRAAKNRGNAYNKSTQHHRLAAKAARESIVLLRNQPVRNQPVRDQPVEHELQGTDSLQVKQPNHEPQPGQLLPLPKGCRVALIGSFAQHPRYQGAGSSKVRAAAVESMTERIGSYSLNCIGYAEGYALHGRPDPLLCREALELARKADTVLYCFGLDESSEAEGVDRAHMRIPQNQIDLLTALYEVNPRIVGILSAGSAVEMPWHECCCSLLHCYLGGQAGAGAMLDVLTGRYNPCGRLAETYPLHDEDTPACHYYPASQRNSEYREGIYIGYRYYETVNAGVLYPFGYGLSYTQFAYSDLRVSEDGVEFTLTNTGSLDGTEVAQMYITGPRGTIFRPARELKGFARITVPAGESRQVRIAFDDKTFRYWDVASDSWETEAGTYLIRIGGSVRDIRLEGVCSRQGSILSIPYPVGQLPHYEAGNIQNVPDEEYELLLGRPIPPGEWSGTLERNDAVCQMYYAKSLLARLIYRCLNAWIKRNEKRGIMDLNILFIYNIPFRAIAKMTHGAVSMAMADAMVAMVNGRFIRGMRQLIGGYIANKRCNREYERKLTESEVRYIHEKA